MLSGHPNVAERSVGIKLPILRKGLAILPQYRADQRIACRAARDMGKTDSERQRKRRWRARPAAKPANRGGCKGETL
jgi:hypothetical protein